MNLFSNDSVFSLQHELNKLSKLLGNHGIETRFRGRTAYTDGKRVVNLPAMPMERKLTDEQQRVLRGFHVHEVSHVQNTSFRIWKRELGKQDVHPMLKDTWNAIEDVFIERKAIENYAGARRNLESVVEKVFSEAMIEAEEVRQEDDYIWAMEVPFALCGLGRIELGYHSVSLRQFCDGLPDEVKAFCEPFIKRVAKTNSTRKTFDLATEVLEQLNIEITQSQQQTQSQDGEPQDGEQGDEQGEGSQGEGSQGGEQDSPEQQGDSSDSQGNPMPADGEGEQGDGEQSAGGTEQSRDREREHDGDGEQGKSSPGAGGGLPDKTTFKNVETAVRNVVEESGGAARDTEWLAVRQYAEHQPQVTTVEQLLGE